MVRVTWSDSAIDRVEQIRRYLEDHDPVAAERVASRLRSAGQSLDHFPNRGRSGRGGTRELPSVPPYVIIYAVGEDEVVILDVKHGRQRR